MKKIISAILMLLFVTPLAGAATVGDIDGDGQITLNEAIYALQTVAGLSGQGATQEEQEGLEDSTDQTILHMTDPDGETAVESLMFLFEKMGLVAAVESGDAYAYLSNGANFNCGSVQGNGSDTVTFTLSNCGMVGTVQVVIGTDGDYTTFSMTFTDVVVDGCAISGTATVKVKVVGNTATVIIESSSLSLCGVDLDGAITVVMNTITGEFETVTVSNSVSYTMDDGTQVDVDADITYNSDGAIDGTATTTIGGQTYNFVIEDVTVDPACGIPTSGTITVNGFAMDFSSTTCDDPTVTVFIRGVPVQMNLEDALNMVLGEEAVNFLMEELANMVTGVEEIDQVVQEMNFDDASSGNRKAIVDPDAIFNNLKTVDFACGTVSVGLLARQVVFDFDPTSDCGMDGVITVTVTKPDSGIVFELDYDQVQVGGCELDGQATSALDFGSGVITYTHTSTNLTACNVKLNGTFTVVVDATDGSLQSAILENTAAYDGGDDGIVTVDSDLKITQNGISGEMVLTSGDDTYNCTLNNITIDPACGIPNGGTATINGVTLDFSSTTCENQVVIAAVGNVSVELSLEEAVNLLMADDPAAYMISYLSGGDETVQGLEGLQEVMNNAGIEDAQTKYGYGDRKSGSADDILTEIYNQFTCGVPTIDLPNHNVTLAFNGSCGISGTVVITATKVSETIQYDIDYQQVEVNGCVISGTTSTTLTFGEGAVLFTHTSGNLSVCGNVMSGTAVVAIDTTTGSLNYITVDHVVEFEANSKDIKVDASLVYMPGSGFSGEADLTVDEKEYKCTFTNITIDPACGIPNGGTITINEVKLDFTNTSCDNPTVEVSVGGLSTTMAIEDLLEILQSEDPVNALVVAVAGDNNAQEIIGDILDEAGLWEAENRLRARKISGTVSDLLDFYDGFSFACGNILVQPLQKKITIIFDGTDPCYATGGLVIDIEKDGEIFMYTLTFTDVKTNGCSINGTTVGSFTWGANTVTFNHASSNLTFCTSTFNGQSSAIISTADGSLQSVTVDTDITLEVEGETVTISAKLTYDSTGINGTAKIKKGRKTYDCVFANVTLDPACGIPNGGTITVNGIVLDFSSTSCANPNVTVTIRGRSVQMSLQDAINMLS